MITSAARTGTPNVRNSRSWLSALGTYLSVGGLWRVTAVSVGRARASNLLKFLAAGSRRHFAGLRHSRLSCAPVERAIEAVRGGPQGAQTGQPQLRRVVIQLAWWKSISRRTRQRSISRGLCRSNAVRVVTYHRWLNGSSIAQSHGPVNL